MPDAAESGLVIVDKPPGMTSHDVVGRIRRVAGTRRVGHAGTLDPMATGVLVIGVGKATRLLGHLMLTEKTYQATIRLGQSTTTDDADGEIISTIPVALAGPAGPASHVSAETRGAHGVRLPAHAGGPGEPSPRNSAVAETPAALRAGIAGLTGEIMQVPPGVSAVKVGGQRAYKLTRSGQAPDLRPRPVTVYEFTVTGIRQAGDFLDIDATIRCSSGTYVRALARDLGTALGTGGHLTALRRAAVGPYRLAQARTLEELESLAPAKWLIPLADAAAAAFPRLDLTADDARRLAQGARLPLPPAPPAPKAPSAGAVTSSGEGWPAPEAPAAAFAPDGTLVALVTARDGRLRSLAVFAGTA